MGGRAGDDTLSRDEPRVGDGTSPLVPDVATIRGTSDPLPRRRDGQLAAAVSINASRGIVTAQRAGVATSTIPNSPGALPATARVRELHPDAAVRASALTTG